MKPRPRPASSRVVPRLAGPAAVLLVVGLVTTLAPAQAAGSPAPPVPRLQVAQVRASAVPTTTGTTVKTTVVVKNRTGARTPAGSARLYLRSDDGRILGLGEIRVPAVPAGARLPVMVRTAAPARTPAGTYAVQACLTPRPDGRCRTSPATVVIEPAELAASPSSVDLGDVPVGSSAEAETTTITNTGHARTGRLDVDVTGDGFSVSTLECGPSLDPGASCDVSVGFAPDAVGRATGTLAVTARRGTTTSVALSGTGTGEAALSISPDDAEFDDTVVGATSDPVTFTVSSVGLVPAGVPDVSLGSEASDFDLTDSTCTAALPPGAACTVTLTFSPGAAGTASDELTVSASPGGSTSADLSGLGLAPASLSLTPPSSAFGSEVVGDETDPVTFTLTNDGDVASGAPTVTLGGADAEEFTITDDGCTAAVPAGGDCAVEVVFAPTATGSASASLGVSATPGGTDTSTLTGTGLAPAALSLTPDDASFGSELVGDESDATTFTLTNTGDVASGAPTVTLGGADAEEFEIVDDACTAALAAGATCDVDVVLTPTSRGAKSASLEVSASPGGTTSADLTGTGLAPARLVVRPDSAALGSEVVGETTSATTLTVTNTGDVASGTPTATLSGADAEEFAIVDDGCTAALDAGDSCDVDVVLAPTSPGNKSASLDVTATPGGTTSSELTGTGLAPAELTVTPTTDFGPVPVGVRTNPQSLIVTNVGDVASGVPSYELAGDDADQFRLFGTSCLDAILPGEACQIDVQFDPASRGAKAASLDVSASPGGAASGDLTGTGLAPAALTLTPGSADLGHVLVSGGATAPTPLTLTNTGDIASGITSFEITGPDADQFAVDVSNCSGVLPPDAACEVEVTVDPSSAGTKSASIVVSASPGGTTSAALSGTGDTPASLSISEPSYDFGYVDAPTEHVFTITNSGTLASGNASVGLTGSSAFTVTTNTCADGVAGGDSCTVGVTYTGSGTTGQSATLSVATPSGDVTAALTGYPVALSISPASHDFGGVLVGSTSDPVSFTLTNHRRTAITITSGTVTGQYTIDYRCFGTPIAAGATCTFPIRFAPTSGGSRPGSVVLRTAADSVTTTLAGTGLTPAALSVSPSTVAFGSYAAGSGNGTRPVSVTNTGTQPTSTLATSIGGASAADFAVVGSTCPDTLAGGASCTLTVAFFPQTLGDKLATLTVTGAPGGSATLTGAGVPTGVTLQEPVYDFGNVPVGASSPPHTFRVINATDAAVNIDFVSTPFTPDTTNFTCVRSIQVIPAHGSCTITISFRPSTTGLRSGTIEASGPSFHTTAAVSGTGVAARGSARHATADPSASAEPERGWTVTLRHGVPVLRRD